MKAISRVISICIALAAAFARPSVERTNIERQEMLPPQNSNNGMMGVASIAGITSRNGRVSSMTGVKFIPGSAVSMTNDGTQFFYPLTVTKESNGKYASGTVQFYPGSVMVSSSARSGFGPEIKPWVRNMPSADEMFFPPIDLFNTPRNIKPLFPMDVFKPPPQITDLGTTWLYPHFNPFVNFWR